MNTAVAAAITSSQRTADRTFAPADELMTLSIDVVGALMTALADCTIVVLDATTNCGLTVVVTEVVVGRVVVRAVVRTTAAGATATVVSGSCATVVGTVVGATVGGVATGSGDVEAGGRVVVGAVLVVVVVGAVVVGPTVVVIPANAGVATALTSATRTSPNHARARVLGCRGARLMILI